MVHLSKLLNFKRNKMKTTIISITFLFLMIATIGLAQNQEKVATNSIKSGFAIYSANFTAGYYSPKMDYWNDTYVTAKGLGNFGGNMAIGANITFSLPADFRARVGASIWSDEVKGTSSTSTVNGLKIGLTRFNLGLLYAPKSYVFTSFQPYLGLEVQENLIKNTSTIGSASITQQGQSMSFAPILGLDRSFGHFNCGLELKYNLGNYNQEEAGVQTLVHKVSISGAEVSLMLGYKF